MTIEETNTSKLDIKYQFRCSVEEREYFQEEVAKSGLKPLEFFKNAVDTLKIQSSPEESILASGSLSRNETGLVRRTSISAASHCAPPFAIPARSERYT